MKQLTDNIGKDITIFTRGKLRFQCKLLSSDEKFLKIQDHKDQKKKYILIDEISTIEEEQDGTNNPRKRTPNM